jgi:hypothetical protein
MHGGALPVFVEIDHEFECEVRGHHAPLLIVT